MTTYATYFHFPTMARHSPSNGLPDTHPALEISRPTHTTQDATRHEHKTMSHKVNSPTTSEQETSLFFRLPAELRNIVYKELLCPNATSLKELAKRGTDLRVRRFNQTTTQVSLYPAILSTCRRIHQEATQMLYTPHTFHAHPTLLTSLPHLGSSSKPVLYLSVTRLITRWQLCLRLDTDPRFTFSQATTAFSGAEYLEIRVWQAQFEACNYAVLKLFTGVRGVQVARVGGSVDAKLAAWLEGLMMRPEGKECACEEGIGEECAEWEQRREVLCGRCYKKLCIA